MPAVTGPIILCTDGSEHSLHALAAGFELLGRPADAVVVAVVDLIDPLVVADTGMTGMTFTPEAYEKDIELQEQAAAAVVEDTASALGLTGAERLVLRGAPGPVICDLADQRGARAIVIGSRGRTGLRRAVLGSVSDHVVRHAGCPVVVSGPEEQAAV